MCQTSQRKLFNRSTFQMVMLIFLKRSVVMKADTIHGESMLGFVSPVVYEVDSMEEFQYIDYQLQMCGSPLRDHLDKVMT